jgi:hypothetical protein
MEPIEDWMNDAMPNHPPPRKGRHREHPVHAAARSRPIPKDPEDAEAQAVVEGAEADAEIIAREFPRTASRLEELKAENLKATVETREAVVLPQHYARFKIEPILFIGENDLSFLQGNVIKYVLRYDAKNGLEDLMKARRYLDMLVLKVKGDPNWAGKPKSEEGA